MFSRRLFEGLIERVKSFNQEKHPVKIVGVGLTGSALRKEDPVDYDVIVICRGTEPYWSEWKQFQKALRDNFEEFVKLIYSIPGKGRRSIEKLLNYFRREVEQLIIPEWVVKWFVWCRVSDFEKGLRYGIPVCYFELSDLIRRYLKKGVNKRFQIMPIIYNPCGELQTTELSHIRYVLVWTPEEGFKDISDKDLLDFLSKEWKELTESARSILYETDLTEIPVSYYDVARLLRGGPTEDVYPYEFKEVALDLRRRWVQKLKMRAKELDKALKEIPVSIGDYKRVNTKIRELLKEMLLLGEAIDGLSNPWTAGAVYNRIYKGMAPEEAIIDVMLTRAPRARDRIKMKNLLMN